MNENLKNKIKIKILKNKVLRKAKKIKQAKSLAHKINLLSDLQILESELIIALLSKTNDQQK